MMVGGIMRRTMEAGDLTITQAQQEGDEQGQIVVWDEQGRELARLVLRCVAYRRR